MSAPNTNLDKQKRRHWVPLAGMALVVIFGYILVTYWLGEEAAQSDPASPAPIETPLEPVPGQALPQGEMPAETITTDPAPAPAN